MKKTTDPLVTVFVLMYYPGGGASRNLCAIFSTALKAKRFANKLRKKLSEQDKKNGAAYLVDSWHVDGAVA